MISAGMMILGTITAILGLGLLIKTILSPFWVMFRSLNGQTIPEENENIQRTRRNHRKLLISISFVLICMGGIFFLAGLYLGYAARGEGFWFHKLFYDSEEAVLCMENITDDGKYIAENGKEYSFYIIVQGDKYEFCSEPCDNFDDLKEKLSHIRLGETFLLVDNYAVAAEYNAAVNLLSEKGYKIEMEEK